MPLALESICFNKEISSFSAHDQEIKENFSKKINARKMRFLNRVVVPPHVQSSSLFQCPQGRTVGSATSFTCGNQKVGTWVATLLAEVLQTRSPSI